MTVTTTPYKSVADGKEIINTVINSEIIDFFIPQQAGKIRATTCELTRYSNHKSASFWHHRPKALAYRRR